MDGSPDKSITRISSSVGISLFAEFLCSPVSPGINTLATLIGRKIGALSPNRREKLLERRFDRLGGINGGQCFYLTLAWPLYIYAHVSKLRSDKFSRRLGDRASILLPISVANVYIPGQMVYINAYSLNLEDTFLRDSVYDIHCTSACTVQPVDIGCMSWHFLDVRCLFQYFISILIIWQLCKRKEDTALTSNGPLHFFSSSSFLRSWTD